MIPTIRRAFVSSAWFIAMTCWLNGVSIVSGQESHGGTLVDEKVLIDAGTLYEAGFFNSDAIESGDVLMRIERFSDSSEAPSQSGIFVTNEHVEFHRIVFDYTNQRYAYYLVAHTKKVVFNNPAARSKAVENNTRSIQGFIWDGDNRFARMIPGDARRLSKNISFSKLRESNRMPDVRTLGFVPVGAPVSYDDYRDRMQQMISGETIKQIREIDAVTTSLTTVTWNPNSTKNGTETERRFDTERLVPLSTKLWLVNDHRRFDEPWSTERFEWEEKNGIQVAIKVARTNKSTEIVNDERCAFDVDTNAKIHWFSLNGKLDESLFELNNLQELDQLMKRCDPESANATSLIENVERKIAPETEK